MSTATISPEVPRTNNRTLIPPLAPVTELPPTRTEPAQKKRQPIMKRAVFTAAIVLVIAGGAMLVHEWWTVGRFMESTDDAYVGGDVTVIAPKVPGFVARLAVTDNQLVHAGDLLIKLDDRDYRAALARAEATVAVQQGALANLEATRHLQEAVIVQAQAQIAATDAETVRTHDDRGRYQRLVDSGAVSAQSFQLADTDYKTALAAGVKAQAALEAAQRQLEVIGAQKQEATATLAQAQAECDLAQLNLSYTELRAPVDGTVGNRSAQTGAYATTGSQLLSLVPVHGLWIDANFKEDQLVNLQPGSPATVKVDQFPGKIFRGHVVSVAPATGAEFSVLPPENATGNFTKIVQRVTVRIVLDEEPAVAGSMRPGLSVTAKVDTRPDTRLNGKSGI